MALAIDVKASGVANVANGGTVTTSSFSTTSGNELLVALVSGNSGTTGSASTFAVSGAGLTWTRAVRHNKQPGGTDIWWAFSSGTLTSVTVSATVTFTGSGSGSNQITVVSLTGIDLSSGDGTSAIGAIASDDAVTGAPSTSLTTTRNGSWVFGCANDWDSAVTVVASSGQTVIRSDKDTTDGDTAWSQQQNSATATSGTVVSISDTAPTADHWNMSIIEVLPAGTTPPPSTVSQMMLLGCGL